MKSWKEFVVVLAVCALVVAYNLRPEAEESSEVEPAVEVVNVTEGMGEPKRELVLVQWDGDPELVQWCEAEIEAFTNVKIGNVFQRNSIPQADISFNQERRQFDADLLVDEASGVFGSKEGATLAVTRDDLYLSSKPEWRYCFGTHGPKQTAILSSVRMGGRFQEEIFPNAKAKDRFRKMLLRYVLEMTYDLPRNNDPKSLLYNRVLGPRDLDAMEYRV